MEKLTIVTKSASLTVDEFYDLSIKGKVSTLKTLIENLSNTYNVENTNIYYDRGYYGDTDRIVFTETRLETDEEYAARLAQIEQANKLKNKARSEARKVAKQNEIATLKRLATKYGVKLDKEL